MFPVLLSRILFILPLWWDKRTNMGEELICKSSVTQVSCVAQQLLIIAHENTGHQVWDMQSSSSACCTVWIWRFTFNYYTLCWNVVIPLETGLLNSNKNSCIVPATNTKYNQQSKDLIVSRSCLVWGKHQSQLNALHQFNDSLMLCIISRPKYNGYPKQSWQDPSILCHTMNNVLVFGPSAV